MKFNYQKPCACSCGELIWHLDKKGRVRKFKQYHQVMSDASRKKISESKIGNKNPMYGRRVPTTPEIRQKLRQGKLGEKNPNWKGDAKINYTSLHTWVRNYLPIPSKCEICNDDPPYDLANITGIYDREFKNWQYLCRRCHMLSDGRMYNLIHYHKTHPILNSEVKK